MGQIRNSIIRDFQERAGIEPATGQRAAVLSSGYFRRAMAVATTKPTREMAGVSRPTLTSTEKLGPSADSAA